MRRLWVRILRSFTDFWWGDRGLTAFLLLLFAFIFLAPFFELKLLRSLSTIFFTLLLISGVACISPRLLLRWSAGAVALTAIVLRWLQDLSPGRGVIIASSLSSLIFLGCLTLVLLVRVFSDSGSVSPARIRGAMAAYLLFGISWAILYRLLDLCLPGAFSMATGMDMPVEEKQEVFTYFSFVTLTTLGYGDITARHAVVRMFVILEALVGQLYPATLLARLVSLEIGSRKTS